jgi:hypothetical protein
MTGRDSSITVIGVLIASFVASPPLEAAEPLANAHAHNDYRHARPLFDALDHGFMSVEADVFLVDGQLLVGHARDELRPDRTLESLYLNPLSRRVRQNGGGVYPDGKRFLLFVDIKTGAQPAVEHLRKVLTNYTEMLSTIYGGVFQQRAVTVVVTGNRPQVEAEIAKPLLFGVDGRASDLASDLPAHRMPVISDNWTSHFAWKGDGPMPEAERAKLQEFVKKAHNAKRLIRFWATPESESVWRELQSAGVDLIGTDQLGRLAAFFRPAGDESKGGQD